MRESQLAASLDHPNVVPVYDAGEADGHVFIAMRFVDGTDLGAELRKGPMTPERAIEVAAQVADCAGCRPRTGPGAPGRQAVERAGRCPRPLLPDGFRAQPVGRRARPRADGALAGTVGYVSPEQVRGDASTAAPTSTRWPA